VRVLSIDGGGIRGLIPALVLAEIERRCEQPAGELFDLVAGTSTGAIIACALTRPDPLPAERIAQIYVEDGPEIFSRTLLKKVTSVNGLVDERYDAAGLVASLERHLGDAQLSQADPDLLLTVYDLETRESLFLDRETELSMVVAAHASSAAPSYFEPVRVGDMTLVDGGVFATNPAMCAYATAVEDVELLVSLGTGQHTRRLPYDEVKDWGQLEWARPIIDVVFDAGADAVDIQLGSLIGDDYVRLQTQLNEASDDLDDASPENLAALAREAERLIAEHEDELERICQPRP
jgi:predicted acylesterase/phospholipase RssA